MTAMLTATSTVVRPLTGNIRILESEPHFFQASRPIVGGIAHLNQRTRSVK